MLEPPKLEVPQRATIAALLCLAFGLAFYDASSQRASPQQQLYGASEAKQNSQAITPPAVISSDQVHAADHQTHGRENENWLTYFLEAKLTDWFIVIFTGLLAWTTSGLFRETGKLRTAADKQEADFLRSVQAAEKAALAAEASAETGKTEFISTHRPRINYLARGFYRDIPGRRAH